MERLIPMNPVDQHISDQDLALTENEAFRQQALIANLWVILFTIAVSATLSLPFAQEQRANWRSVFPSTSSVIHSHSGCRIGASIESLCSVTPLRST